MLVTTKVDHVRRAYDQALILSCGLCADNLNVWWGLTMLYLLVLTVFYCLVWWIVVHINNICQVTNYSTIYKAQFLLCSILFTGQVTFCRNLWYSETIRWRKARSSWKTCLHRRVMENCVILGMFTFLHNISFLIINYRMCPILPCWLLSFHPSFFPYPSCLSPLLSSRERWQVFCRSEIRSHASTFH